MWDKRLFANSEGQKARNDNPDKDRRELEHRSILFSRTRNRRYASLTHHRIVIRIVPRDTFRSIIGNSISDFENRNREQT